MRTETENANKHPYLFVTYLIGTSLGKALSISGFVKAVSHAVEKVAKSMDGYEPESLVDEIKRNGFRYVSNDRLSKQFDRQNELTKTDPDSGIISVREQN